MSRRPKQIEYKVEYYMRHFSEIPDGASAHTTMGLSARLNELAADGWRLMHMPSLHGGIGWILILEKEA